MQIRKATHFAERMIKMAFASLLLPYFRAFTGKSLPLVEIRELSWLA